MKTHIFLALMTIFVLSSCASQQGRDISSTQEERDGQYHNLTVQNQADRFR